MGDIVLQCRSCGHEFKVSEFISEDYCRCPLCESLVKVVRRPQSGPVLQLRDEKAAGKGSQDEEPPAVTSSAAAPGKAVFAEIHRTPRGPLLPGWLITWSGFLSVGGILVGMEYLLSAGFPQGVYYFQIRNALGILIYLLTLLSAFNDSALQGLVCLVFPPYLLYYVAVRSEVRLLRGAFLALLVALAAELHFLPDASLISELQRAFNELVEAAGAGMERLSAPPPKM